MDISPAVPASDLSLCRLGTAPHRLMFFIGASNLLLAMAWWAAWLAAARWPGVLTMHQPQPVAGWLHAFVMQYQVLPSFMFGFLLTTFPKWLGLPDLERWRYVPVGLGLFGGQLATLLGAIGWEAGIVVGLLLTVAGWLAGVLTLGPMLWREAGVTWHARSCFAALLLGFAGVLAWAAFVLGASPLWAFASIKTGSFGLLLPVYVTIAHRMFPFFASRVVPGYQPWRPMWLLAAFWALCLAHLALELLHAYGWLWLADVPLLALTATMLWRWWPTDRNVLVPRAQDAQERPTAKNVLVPRAGAPGIVPPAPFVHPSTSQDAQERPTGRDPLVPSTGSPGVLPPTSLAHPGTSQETQERPTRTSARPAGMQAPPPPRPALLMLLFVGLAWLPVAFALYATQSIAYLLTGVFSLGRAPAHALFIGFFGSVLVAMVTRVTQGHAGRPLRMPAVAWFAFVAIQMVTLMRLVAELVPDPYLWQTLAALGWLIALGPWVARLGWIYLAPRADGKAG